MNMWILVLEAMLALAILVFIVWWTMAPVKRREDRLKSNDAEKKARQRD